MKNKRVPADDPLDHEIDFSKGRPNPYWLGLVNRHCVRVLDEDLAPSFPDNESVNEALRAYRNQARRSRGSAVSGRRVSASKKAPPK